MCAGRSQDGREGSQDVVEESRKNQVEEEREEEREKESRRRRKRYLVC